MVSLTERRGTVSMVRRVLVCGVLATVALVPAAVWALGTLDQQQTDIRYSFETGGRINGSSISGGTSLAQTFTPAVTGLLDRVDLTLESGSNDNLVGVLVQIRDVDTSSHAPGSHVLASTTVPVSTLWSVGDSGGTFEPITFPNPAYVVAGTQYAIVLYTEGGSERYRWHGSHVVDDSNIDPYTGGSVFISTSSPPLNWAPPAFLPNVDAGFKTYVTAAPPPTTAECDGLPATIVGTAGDDAIPGTSGDDVIAGLGGKDAIAGQGGHDVICGGEGNDSISGSSGNDTINGGSGDDRIVGGSGNDTLRGQDGADQVSGGEGVDGLSGGDGAPDTCDGGAGTDSGGSGCENTYSIP